MKKYKAFLTMEITADVQEENEDNGGKEDAGRE